MLSGVNVAVVVAVSSFDEEIVVNHERSFWRMDRNLYFVGSVVVVVVVVVVIVSFVISNV